MPLIESLEPRVLLAAHAVERTPPPAITYTLTTNEFGPMIFPHITRSASLNSQTSTVRGRTIRFSSLLDFDVTHLDSVIATTKGQANVRTGAISMSGALWSESAASLQAGHFQLHGKMTYTAGVPGMFGRWSLTIRRSLAGALDGVTNESGTFRFAANTVPAS